MVDVDVIHLLNSNNYGGTNMCKEKIINIDMDESVDDDDNYDTFDFLDDDDDAEVNVEWAQAMIDLADAGYDVFGQ